ncbi:hypothetical protein SAMN06269117_11358 [Balnearium lithotrophicum]|uniref:Uncharacterized protein n=1 Tax=Balnearium lithotrophicum TaxID=223788 RepID=A0A521CK08_9BACT|nr:hypothetical protein [Balnearium lithotrophicum]SMO59776.1 hypothetical protein SAMN06269117_11358 [Balnearium lithotrophicum]
MVGAPGGWECMVKRKLKQRRERTIRKEKLKTFLLRLVLFPAFLVFIFFNNAKNISKSNFNEN